MQEIALERFQNRHAKDVLRNATESGIIGCAPINSYEQSEHRLRSLINGAFSEFYTLSVCGECKGCVYAYEHKPDDLHMKVALESLSLSAREHAEAMRLFLLLLFKRYPLKKVFFESVEGDILEVWINLIGFKHELTLASARFIGGVYKDLSIFSCYREEFDNEGLSAL